MHVKKITVSALVFVLILTASAVLSHRMTEQRSKESVLTPHNYTFTIYSSRYSTHSPNRAYPFSPREYIRIIHRLENEQPPEKLQ